MSEIQIRDFSSYTDLLPTQFSDSENLIKLLSIYLDQVEELNLAQQSLGEVSTDLEAAFGYQLDLIGNLLGVSRLGMGDNDYRDAIRFGISVNTGSGTPEDVIGFLQTITKATKIRYWEHYPACTVLETNGTNIPKAIPSTLDNVTPAGVKTGGVIVVKDNICFRPCRLSEAYANIKPITPPDVIVDIDVGDTLAECGGEGIECATGNTTDAYSMGESDAELGNPSMEMMGVLGTAGFFFEKVPPNTLFGNSILPNVYEVYDLASENFNEMGGGFEMGEEIELEDLGNYLVQKPDAKKGRCANVLTNK